MTPECLSREASPGPESYPDSSVSSPAGQMSSQSAPGSPGHPYAPSSQPPHKGRLMQQITVVTNGVTGDTSREGNHILSLNFCVPSSEMASSIHLRFHCFPQFFPPPRIFIANLLFEVFSDFFTDKYVVSGNATEEHSLSPAGQYSPAPVIVQTTYNYRYVSSL